MINLRFLSYLQAKKLTCPRFMDTGTTHETPRTEIQYSFVVLVFFLTAIAVARVALFWGPFPKPHLSDYNTKRAR